MKFYVKIFAISFIVFTLIFGGITLWILDTLNDLNRVDIEAVDAFKNDDNLLDSQDEEELDPYAKMINDSKRFNVLLLGTTNNLLTDTIIVASFDPTSKVLDFISLPRDTYYEREGYNGKDQRKLNAAYGVRENRAQSAMNAVSDVLGMPIHNFVKVDYAAVAKIVDAVGGITVNIPFNMYYTDPYDKPPLVISFTKGQKHLNGSDAVKYLRFRKNDDGSHSDGDIGRINRQQDFVNKLVRKSLGLNLPRVVGIAKEYVETGLSTKEILSYTNSIIGMKNENIRMHVLPGVPEYIDAVSYYTQNKEETKALVTELYGGIDGL